MGSRLTEALVRRGDSVLILDDLSAALSPAVTDHERIVHLGGLGDPAAAQRIAGFAPTAVFHLAARHFIPWCIDHPEETYDVNVRGSAWLLRILPPESVKVIVIASSAAIYGFGDRPFVETDPPNPRNVYAETKHECELLACDFADRHPGVRVVAARLFNVYGSGDPHPHVLPDLLRAVRAGEEIRLGNTWPQRDYVHVADIATALVHLAEGPAGFGAYNVGTGLGHSVLDLIRHIESISSRTLTVVTEQARQRADDGHLVADITLIRQRTCWQPRTMLRAGLEDLIKRGAA